MQISLIPRTPQMTPTSPIENQPNLTHPKYRADLDGLRAVAVMSVVGFHVAPSWIRGGFVGVDIFFVISGYLISSIIFENLNQGTFTFREFYIRRIRRIFPALIVVMTTCYLLGWFTLFQFEFGELGRDIAGGAGFVSNLIFWRNTNYWGASVESSPLLHLWSLGVEEQFYILWPLTVLLLWKRQWNIGVFLVAIALTSFTFNVIFVNAKPVATFYLPITRFWELLVGSGLAWFSTHRLCLSDGMKMRFFLVRSIRGFDDGQSFVGAALLGLAFATLNSGKSFPGWWALLPTVGTCLIISAGPRALVNRIFLSHPVLVWFGLISYPLYLWHWPILSFQFQFLNPQAPPYQNAAIAVLASVVLSALTFKFVEKPIRLGILSIRKLTVLTVIMIMIGVLGISTNYYDGFPARSVNISEKAKFVAYHQSLNSSQEWNNAMRGECNFLGSDNSEKNRAVPRSCRTKGIVGTWFLWGDSHAMALSYGLRSILPKGVELAQISTQSCGPGRADRGCDVVNDYVISVINELKPEIVLMAQRENHEQVDWASIERTLKQAGVGSVILIGPAPQWKPTLPTVLAYYYTKQTADRVKIGIDTDIIGTDNYLRKKYENSGLHYISLINKLCTQDGCLATIPKSSNLITHDYGHLSIEGSRFVSTNILSQQLARGLE